MAIGPITAGQTRPSWVVTYLRADNTAVDLTGATYTGLLYDPRTSTRITLSPSNYSTTNATAGIFTYAPQSSDISSPGAFWWQTIITISSQTYYVLLPYQILITPSYA